MTKIGLHGLSKSYYDKFLEYVIFSQAEDYPQKVFQFLKPKIKNKIVLDVGCGNGKYLALFSPYAKEINGLDQSKDQIKLCQNKIAKIKNVKLFCSSAQTIDLPDKYADVAISCWVLGTIDSLDKKTQIINETLRVLKRSGKYYLVENDNSGEFEQIRERINDPLNRTKNYNNWLESNGFVPVKRIKTYFKYKSLTEAKNNIKQIWSSKIGKNVKSQIIKHNLVIYQYLPKTLIST